MLEALRIPGYQDFRLIGRGGSATVLRARQVQLERDVAIKVLRPGEFDQQTKQLFDAERRALGRLPKHPNIVTVFDSGFTDEGDPFLVMELCASGSLSSLVKAEGPLELEHVVRIGLKISEALESAHQHGMIHRDVKPENILISDRGEPVLSDFGIASVLEDGGTSDGAMSPHHVAPELLRSVPPSASSDLYSLGSTLFYLMVGRTPHQNVPGERLAISEVLSRVLNVDFSTELPPGVDAPREVRNVIRSLLAKDPRKRLKDAGEAMDAFANLEVSLGSARRRLALPTRNPDVSTYVDSEDPESTIFGRRQESFGPTAAPYVERSTPSTSPSMSMGSVGDSLNDSHRFRTSNPVARDTAPPFDEDMTIVASAAKRAGDSRSFSASATGSAVPLVSGDVASQPSRTLDKRQLGVIIAALILAAVGISLVVRSTGSAGKAAPLETEVTTSEVQDFPLTPPSNVVLRSLGNDLLEVTWDANADPGVQYQLEINRGEELLRTIEVAAPPARVESLDLAMWSPCIAVSALDTSSGRIAEAKAICYERESATLQANTEPGQAIPDSVQVEPTPTAAPAVSLSGGPS
jgi:serine/threonine protein kinase